MPSCPIILPRMPKEKVAYRHGHDIALNGILIWSILSQHSSRSTLVTKTTIDIQRERQDVGVLLPHQKALNLGTSLCLQ